MTLEERIAEVESFMQFAQTIWPRDRKAKSSEIARRCSKCLVSEKFSSLTDSVCEYCLNTKSVNHEKQMEKEKARQKMKKELHQLLSDCQGRGKKNYDALLLFSGGKDSAYLLHQLQSRYKNLRILALMIDNGFASPIAFSNIKQIFNIVDVDHIIFKPNKSLFEKTFRHALTHLNKGGCYTTVDRMDGDLTFDIGRNMAASLHIPLMIAGLSSIQIEDILGLTHFESPTDIESKKRQESASFDLEKIYSIEEMKNWWDGTKWEKDGLPRVIYPFYAWDYDEQKVLEEVVKLGLIPKGQENPIITNNDLIPVNLALDICVLGYSGFEPEFAKLVREGKANRQIWLNVFESLEYLTARGEFLPKCIEETLSRLKLSKKELGVP